MTTRTSLQPAAGLSRLQRRLLAFAPALVALGMGLATAYGFHGRDVSEAWVSHTDSVLVAAEELRGALTDAETGQRGYLLTGDTAFLEPYRSAVPGVARAARALRTLTRDNASQQRRLDTVDRLVAVRLALLDSNIAANRAGGFGSAADFDRVDRGNRTMHGTRDVLGRLMREERRLLAEREGVAARERMLAWITLVLGVIVTAAVAATINRILGRFAEAQAAQARDLAGQNERLEEQAAEMEMQQQELQEQAEELEQQTEEIRTGAEELERANAVLQGEVRERTAANAGLEAFAYTVSHDLRTPLGAINGMAQILGEDYGATLDDEGRQAIARILANARHMAGLIDGLLELSRANAGDLRLTEVDVSGMAREIGAGLTRAHADRPVALEVADGLVACADRRLVTSLVQNLLANAWKFTGKAAEPRIEVGQLDAGPDAAPDAQRTFYVRDNGAGFDPGLGEKLFGAFQRLHRQDDFEGTGVGLATVRRVAERHGGRVWAEGAVGQGATFYFTLPGRCQARGDTDHRGAP